MLVDEVFNEPELWREEIVKMQTMTAPIILFGAGNTRVFNLQYFRRLGIFPVAFCDNSPSKVGGKVDDLDILSFDEVRKKYPNAYFYITTQMYYRELREQIIEGGYALERISWYDVIFQLQWEKDCMNFYGEHRQEIELLYQSLADDYSKKVLQNRLLFLQTRNHKYLMEIRERKQYFDEALIDLAKVECFIDLGMYTGDTISQFITESKGRYRKIYGFEPDESIYQTAKENLQEYDNIVLVKKAASDCDGRIQVAQALGAMQTIENGVFGETEKEDNLFEVCKLDTYFEKQPISNALLKLDIEGAEMAALRGGTEWIKKNRPGIAVCVYHKQEDILDIPSFCKSLIPDYKVYLRHYSDTQTETVCYLIP